MRLSRESRYALTALAALTHWPVGSFAEAREIAEVAGVPGPFLAKIFQRLAAAGVLASQRGRGYALPRPAEAITVREIIEAVEGNNTLWTGCIFWREQCDDSAPCPLHFRWREMKQTFEESVGGITLADIRDEGLPADEGALADGDMSQSARPAAD